MTETQSILLRDGQSARTVTIVAAGLANLAVAIAKAVAAFSVGRLRCSPKPTHSIADTFTGTRPQEVSWSVPLDQDDEHATYDPAQVAAYFAAATQAAPVLAAVRAPYRGRSTQVNAWWGSFDLAVSLYSGRTAEPPSSGFVMRNAMDAQEVAIGWWPGDERHPGAAFYSYAHPAPPGYAEAKLAPGFAYWDRELGEYLLEWDDVRRADAPHDIALEFARSAARHACAVCGWNPELAATVDSHPPPLR